MAKKEVGYVELEWECPVCETRNPGTRTTCSGCGSPQPDDVSFEVPAGAELVTDQERIQRAKGGPDIHCAYCGARNPSGAQRCRQCGADLSVGEARDSGQVLGAYGAEPAPEIRCPACETLNPAGAKVCSSCGAPLASPLAEPIAAAPPRRRGRRGMGRLFIPILVVVAVAVLGFVFLSMRTSELVGTVTEAQWTRSIWIEGLRPAEHSAWRDQVPEGATLGACRGEVRRTQDEPAPGAIEVCGTPYTVDTGTGMGRVVQDCQYQILDERCSYTVLEWTTIDTKTAGGSGIEPEWPALDLQGDEREGRRSEEYRCVFRADGDSYTVTTSSWEKYQRCRPGSRWILEVNSFGSVVDFRAE